MEGKSEQKPPKTWSTQGFLYCGTEEEGKHVHRHLLQRLRTEIPNTSYSSTQELSGVRASGLTCNEPTHKWSAHKERSPGPARTWLWDATQGPPQQPSRGWTFLEKGSGGCSISVVEHTGNIAWELSLQVCTKRFFIFLSLVKFSWLPSTLPTKCCWKRRKLLLACTKTGSFLPPRNDELFNGSLIQQVPYCVSSGLVTNALAELESSGGSLVLLSRKRPGLVMCSHSFIFRSFLMGEIENLLIQLLEHFKNVIWISLTPQASPRTEHECADTALLGSIKNQTD